MRRLAAIVAVLGALPAAGASVVSMASASGVVRVASASGVVRVASASGVVRVASASGVVRVASASGVVRVASASNVASAASRPRAASRRVFPSRLLVYAQEWSLTPSRATLPAGRVIVQLWNRGMDAHDLRARRLNAAGQMVGRTSAVKITLPGGVRTATWTLSPGRYQLYCSLPGHMAMGMHVRIRVIAR